MNLVMKRSHKILIVFLCTCFGSLGFAIMVQNLDKTIFLPNGNVMIPSSWISYMGSNVNPILAYIFWIMLIVVIIYTVFIFRQKILRTLS